MLTGIQKLLFLTPSMHTFLLECNHTCVDKQGLPNIVTRLVLPPSSHTLWSAGSHSYSIESTPTLLFSQ